MSRTDKDAPWRVRVEWFKPSHHTRCPDYIQRRWQHWNGDRPCDLPPEPDRHHRRSWTHPTGCTWEPTGWDRRYYTWPPNHLDRHAYWWGPDRANTRDLLKSAAKEYRAASEVDSVPDPVQHRHAMWGGGWWD